MKISAMSFTLLPFFFAGCLSSAPKAPTCWTVDKDHSSWPPADIVQTADAVRVSRVGVSAPYNSMRIAVLRSDGSVAFDSFNAFAVSPSSLLAVATRDAVRQYGAFKRVLSSGSAARANYSLEFDIGTLALDCRDEGARKARVGLEVTLLDGRDVVAVADAQASVAAKGDYSESFSTAFFHAVADALSKLPVK